MTRNNLLFLILILACTSCNKEFDTVESFQEYIKEEDNKYSYYKNINGIDFHLQYCPTDLLVKQELNTQDDHNTIESTRKKYSQYMYFKLSFSKDNRDITSKMAFDNQKFSEISNTLAFDIDNKIHLYTTNQDTLKMLDFIHPRLYGMGNSNTIMLVYPRKQEYMIGKYLNLLIEDIGISTGDIKFKIDTKAINEEPTLIF